MKAALIATGNEIVSGQTLNTNSSWLASELSKEGLDTHFHMAVADNEDDLNKALNWLKNENIDHVFISGGLGPTRDDLTRKIVADFCQKDFEFCASRWKDLEERLSSYGITPREGHKWQCYFPEGAMHLINSVGTAWGFKTQTQDDKMSIWTLPGPPKEFENVFKNSILPWLKESAKPEFKLVTWQCLNTPESEVAHLAEEELKGCSYEIGYRASPPITELKMWVPVSEIKGSIEDNKWVKKIDHLFKEILYSKNNIDYLKPILDSFREGDFSIFDSITEGDILKSIKTKSPSLLNNIKYTCVFSLNDNTGEDSMVNEENDGHYLKIYHSTRNEKNNLDLKEGVNLKISNKVFKDKVFFEEIDSDLLRKSKRARKLVFAKLIKKAFKEISLDL